MTLKKIYEPQLAVLDDAFAHRVGVQEGVDALRTQIRQVMQHELDSVLREKLKAQVIEQLLAVQSVSELPQVLLDQEFRHLEARARKQQKQEAKTTAGEVSLSEALITDLQQAADRRVRVVLLFKAIIEKYQLTVDEAHVQQACEYVISAFRADRGTVGKIYENENIMQGIRSAVLEEQVIDKLLEEVEYTEKKAEYSEVMALSTEK